MSKTTVAAVEALGLSSNTFGLEGSAWTAFVQGILDTASMEIREAVGAEVYDASASGTVTFARIARAEAYYAAQELMTRAEAISQRAVGSDDKVGYTGLRTMKTVLRDEWRDEVNRILYSLGVSYPLWETDPSVYQPSTVSSIITGSHFAEDQ